MRIAHRLSNSFALEAAIRGGGRFHDDPGAVGRRQDDAAELHRGIRAARPGPHKLSERDVLFDSDERIDMPVAERRLGYVFQNLALFPHLTVAQNVQYGIAKLPAERTPRADDGDARVVSHRASDRAQAGLRFPAASANASRSRDRW